MSATSTASDIYRALTSRITTGNNRTRYTLTGMTIHTESFEDDMDQDEMTLTLHGDWVTKPGPELHTLTKVSDTGGELRYEPETT